MYFLALDSNWNVLWLKVVLLYPSVYGFQFGSDPWEIIVSETTAAWGEGFSGDVEVTDGKRKEGSKHFRGGKHFSHSEDRN